MTRNSIAMPIPPALDPATLTDGRFTLRVESDYGEALLHFDAERRIGASFVAAAGMWSMWWPLSFDQFVAGVARLKPRESPGFDEWAAACTGTGSSSRMQ
jgi:hypothetical protein